MHVPRTLLLTLWPPDARYKILYRYVHGLPPEQILCATLQPRITQGPLPFNHRAFEPRAVHWRLRSTSLAHVYVHHLQAQYLARQIADWARPFRPEVLWVLPELGAAAVGYQLQQLLDVPLHLTAHDAHETARHIVPRFYYHVYARAVMRIFRAANSVDSVSFGLVERLQAQCRNIRPENSLVIPPSIARNLIAPPASASQVNFGSGVRRIGLCGSMRISREQWQAFLDRLAALQHPCEILAYAYDDLFHEVPLPSGVTLLRRPFVETEADLIDTFRREGVHALYLGLWREERRALFGKTSLSAKLTTYAAAGLPIIVDGRSDSEAWRLVNGASGGVLCSGDAAADVAALNRLFLDSEHWERTAAGARQLCLDTFTLEDNTQRLAERLAKTAARALAHGSFANAANA